MPVMVGSLRRAGKLVQGLFANRINTSPIIYPGVPINAARLRFFVTSEHTTEQIRTTVRTVRREMDRH